MKLRGENPIGIIGRRFFIQTTKTEKAFKKGEIEKVISYINGLQIICVKYFYIFSPACMIFKYVIENKKFMEYSFKFLDKLDKILMRISKNPQKQRNMPQKYIKNGTKREVNQNPLMYLPIMNKLSWIEVIICKKIESR